MQDKLLASIEAFKILKEWSCLLITIQTAIFVVLAAVVVFGNKQNNIRCSKYLNISIILTSASIVIGFNVVGTIPWSLQNIYVLLPKYGNIYQLPNYIDIPLWFIAFMQHLFTVLAIISVVILLCKFSRSTDGK